MSIRNDNPEQIVAVLRQVEVSMGNGETAHQACKGNQLPKTSNN